MLQAIFRLGRYQLFEQDFYITGTQCLRLFVWGMAIHTATDVFVHSAWEIKADGNYGRIKHGDGDPADDKNHIEKRYDGALAVAKAALKKCYSNSNGSVSDFDNYVGNNVGDEDEKFYLYNLCTYAKQLGVTPSTNLTNLDLVSKVNKYTID